MIEGKKMLPGHRCHVLYAIRRLSRYLHHIFVCSTPAGSQGDLKGLRVATVMFLNSGGWYSTCVVRR